MRILFLSHFFPPLNAIASHRAWGWARAWAEQGHEVHEPQEHVDHEQQPGDRDPARGNCVGRDLREADR